MLATYEATLQPDGRLQFTETGVQLDKRPHRVLVTFTEEAVPAAAAAEPSDWQSMVGVLAGSPHWEGDPVAIQHGMRDEWH